MGVEPDDFLKYQKYKDLFDTAWGDSQKMFGDNIQYVTAPFTEAIGKSIKKTLHPDLIEEFYKKERAGCVLMGEASLCYYVYPMPTGFIQLYFEFRNHNNGNLILDAFTYTQLDNKFKGTSAVFFPARALKNSSEKELLQTRNSILIATLNFIEYADVETKNLSPKESFEGFNCVYANDTKNNIKILNSTWFTNLVKSDAFKVRGHFRLQPYKMTKRIIWINEFEKHGYTRNAGILKNGE
jgi:hypothetical protein